MEVTMPVFLHSFSTWLGNTEFSKLVVGNKWWWAFMMDMHFIGLALLIGTIGTLDLRMLGFSKQMPIGPLHRLIPWAILGFSINLVTGVLAFIGMPVYYTYDIAFWLKMLTILLAGVNVLVFYWSGLSAQIERIGAGEDAPLLAKVIAATSLILWFMVLILGRYIQFYANVASQ
jgi:hypothetical protein